MAITASGLYGLTLEKMFIDTLGLSTESETAMHEMLVLDAYTPAFDTHNFRDDVTNEATGTAYTSGGSNITGTEWTIGSPSAGVMKWDHDDVSWASSTIANAMGAVDYFDRGGASSADELFLLLDFVTAVSTTNGTLLVQIHADGAVNLDYTP
jgi:hypothetical protein